MGVHTNLTIVVAAYNVENYISQTLESISYSSLDPAVIVVNDGSTDETLKVAQAAFNEFELDGHIVSNDKNIGLSSTRNVGLSLVKTDFVQFLDGDDVLHSENLDFLMSFTDDAEFDYLQASAMFFRDAEMSVSNFPDSIL